MNVNVNYGDKQALLSCAKAAMCGKKAKKSPAMGPGCCAVRWLIS
ncbi:hypothetical protein N0K08_17740 [Acidovorax sp. Be4]|uniref:Uncharacterized protein n=1 Tax=Acidovorax bellezanensis TaxID=2976702 RepID=A0ABT2PPV3_9BURK|nr:hypothetical protein [Acidovorax sp. Be4]MCT9812488.1 hypothetical protein [Acidovorax sp. Be4]